MVDVDRITEPDIEGQSVDLGNWPDRVQVNLGMENHILLLVHLREVNVVVILHPHRGADPESDRSQ